ncbi:hypothetical protein DL93DRAFT_1990269 [Clavulina sp. PMI_390]|nr:hypothetical protein DL93DRAFT_1990269 [Clavulina sp. PMI_390]
MRGFPDFLRLPHYQTQPLSPTYSLVGIIAIVCGMAGVIIGTVLAKGQTLVPNTTYLSTNERSTPGYTCNATLIYPGQLFGGQRYNTTFRYQALSQFAYDNSMVSNCTVPQPTIVDVIGPPIVYPRVTVNQTVTCSFDGLGLQPTFAVTELLYFGYPNLNPNSSVNVGALAVDLLKYLHDNTSAHDTYFPSCSVNPLGAAAYRLNEQIGRLSAFNPNFTGYCDAFLDEMPPAVALAAAVRTAIQEDLQYNLRQLPDLLYPCSQRIVGRIPLWNLLWDILTTMSAFLGPLFTIIVLVLNYLEKRAVGPDPRARPTSEIRLQHFEFSSTTNLMEPGSAISERGNTQLFSRQSKPQ